MKGIGIKEYGGVEKLEEIILPTPSLEPDDVLIEVKAAGVNPVDWKIREGKLQKAIPYNLPLILGWDVSGIIKQVGSNVTSFKIGDEVYSRPDINKQGSYTDEIVVKQDLVAYKPKNLTFAEAASIPLVGLTAWQALIDFAQLKEGHKLLIHAGAGGIGTMAIQIAKSIGAIVTTTTSEKNTEFVKSLGADYIINYDKEDFTKILSNYDVVFDSLGGQTILDSYRVLKESGKLVTIFGSPDMSLPDCELAKKKNILTNYVFTNPNGKQLDVLTQYIEANKIKPVIFQKLPLTVEGVITAHRMSETERVRGKLVLIR
ncbi:NADP-dependent oxidoreductase [Priestia megaterium]|uniref:NADP-dependent oxidoreductase n=1 Tax=Priestia megaterium TaxID=1404 RepID=UPI0025A4A7A3|nr:NADP-dependent oxidoreductase [Priestia megaterium]MDM8150089.1 NADP-dependent oxidoreductase [Priestia megaterium]